MTSAAVALDFLAGQLADVEVGWSLGTFGAIAEFTRDADETVALDRSDDAVSAVTARGGICIKTRADLRAIASESLTPSAWNQRVALCLPEAACAMSARTVLTEVGLDGNALRADDRSASLFDLGLGAMQIDACVRSADPDVVAALRDCVGRSVFAAGNDAMRVILAANPHRVFISRIGRIEVFQPISAARWNEFRRAAYPRAAQAAEQRANPRRHRADSGGVEFHAPISIRRTLSGTEAGAAGPSGGNVTMLSRRCCRAMAIPGLSRSRIASSMLSGRASCLRWCNCPKTDTAGQRCV